MYLLSRRIAPWMPVAIVVVLVGAIIAGLLLVRGLRAGPSMGDHVHAALEIYTWGQKQPHLPVFPSGVHTHGDGLIHIHPQHLGEEARGASMGKFFDYGGWQLRRDAIRLPDGEEYSNGDIGLDGRPGTLRVLQARTEWRSAEGGDHDVLTLTCSELSDDEMEELGDFVGYIPKDGDCLRVIFGPEGESSAYAAASQTPAAEPHEGEGS